MLQLWLLCLCVHWSLLLAIPVMSSLCPPRCKCNELKLSVLCNDTQTDNVPIFLNPKLLELSLSRNRVKNVYSSFTVYQDLKFLDLSHNLISDIDRKSFTMHKLRVLLLGGNQLRELHARVFMGLNRLETLDLSHNQISTISREAFFGLLNLKHLHLQFNRLKQVPTTSFFYLQSLVTLNLANNVFNHLAELAFSPLGAQLQELNLDSNHISQINVRAFVHLQNLTKLNLENNRLFQVPSEPLSVLSNLEMLTISRNHISILRPHAFKGLSQLRTLVIANSPLSHMDRDALRDNPRLTRLVMDHNRQLTRIEPSTFAAQFQALLFLSLRANRISSLEENTINLDRVEYLDLQDNPLVCNCSLDWLAQYLRASNKSKMLKEQIRCHRPTNHAGKTLITLSRSDLSCPQMVSSLEWTFNVLTGVVLGLVIIICLVLICRRHRPKCGGLGGSVVSQPHAEHMIVGGEVARGAKSRLDHSLYYPTIINEDLTRYQTMTTSSACLSVDLHPPLAYVPIAHL